MQLNDINPDGCPMIFENGTYKIYKIVYKYIRAGKFHSSVRLDELLMLEADKKFYILFVNY